MSAARLLLIALVAACGGSSSPRERAPAPRAIDAGVVVGSCHAASDCPSGQTCFAPDFQPTGVTPCTADDFCAAMGGGMVCTRGQCVAPCSPTSCGAGYACSATRHCDRIACDAPGGTCDELFHCHAGRCERTACATDAECGPPPHSCFGGACYDHPGRCAPAAACCPP